MQETELCKLYDVNAYPAVRLFRGLNHATRYRGPRKATAITSYMIKEQLPVVTTIDQNNLNKFKSIDTTVLVAYLDPMDTELANIFTAVAVENHQRYVFGVSKNARVAQLENLSIPSVACYKMREGDGTVMNGRFNKNDVEKFLQLAAPSVIGEITKRNIDSYMNARKPIAYIFASTEDEQDALRRDLTPVAKKYQQYINFGLIDAVEYRHMASSMNLQSDVFPAFVFHNILNDQVYPYNQHKDITAGGIDEFILSILQGRVSGGAQGSEPIDVEDGVRGVKEHGVHDEL
ncbi:hypothetical protein AOQ84DRAFT_345252 [Glonium stellatum]|uniref:protein disulfide-isomerase n=1 Tax=Glonium stellatum TaxID=574774 RepID=A0A8E2EV17_9PEZI|nr:hypothetical protein AOQ84DRAFT_345252 [Glonium stellatum]